MIVKFSNILKDKNCVIHCQTREENDTLMDILHKKGENFY